MSAPKLLDGAETCANCGHAREWHGKLVGRCMCGDDCPCRRFKRVAATERPVSRLGLVLLGMIADGAPARLDAGGRLFVTAPQGSALAGYDSRYPRSLAAGLLARGYVEQDGQALRITAAGQSAVDANRAGRLGRETNLARQAREG